MQHTSSSRIATSQSTRTGELASSLLMGSCAHDIGQIQQHSGHQAEAKSMNSLAYSMNGFLSVGYHWPPGHNCKGPRT